MVYGVEMRRLFGIFIEWCLGYEHTVVVQKDSDLCVFPFRGYPGDAGVDLTSISDLDILPGQAVNVHSGIRFYSFTNIWFELRGRSSTMVKKGLEVISGVIDKDFTGELMAVVYNPTSNIIKISKGERIVQIVPHSIVNLRFVEGKVPQTKRGNKGFGSTSVNV
jgi:dUTP pyrophosphatase